MTAGGFSGDAGGSSTTSTRSWTSGAAIKSFEDHVKVLTADQVVDLLQQFGGRSLEGLLVLGLHGRQGLRTEGRYGRHPARLAYRISSLS
jgi:hypothetical protein